MEYRILIVDDDNLICKSICFYLEAEGFYCFAVNSGEEALERLKVDEFNLILLDLTLPGINGFETMESIKNICPDIQIIMLTASQDINDAIKAIKFGADDYLIKSSNMDELIIIIKKAIKTYSLVSENTLLKKQLERKSDQECITITKSPKMKHIFHLIRKIAELDKSTVLIMGESGTGKELVARTIHNLSQRAEKPFIDISCSALPSSLMESELFGFEKGSFTDAKSQKRGLLELSDGGILFLDEIATLDLSIQAKLLRFLEQRTFRRIGGTIDHKVDLRIIAATNRDLRKKIISNEFREDLFYRLNVFPITIPPLRERKEDILPLTDLFINKFNHEFIKNIKGLHPKSSQLLLQYIYPGNVRELKNIIERAMIMEEGDLLTPASLNFPSGETFFIEPITTELTYGVEESEKQSTFITLAEMEKRHIHEALHNTGGNKAQAAKLLGIGRSTLFRKLENMNKG